MKKILLVVLLLVIASEVYGDEKKCLAENIYFEARGQGQAGWLAVAQVTLNRVEDRRFPNTVCEVVKQGLTYASGDPIRNKCQFSWYCDGKKDIIWANKEKSGLTIEGNARAWREAVRISIYVHGHGGFRVNDNTKGAVYYYAHNLVYPTWADHKDLTVIIGNHTFMK